MMTDNNINNNDNDNNNNRIRKCCNNQAKARINEFSGVLQNDDR